MTVFASTLSDLMQRLMEAWRPATARASHQGMTHDVQTISATPVVKTIMCPHCSAALPEVMEEDACVIFLYCPRCHEKIDTRPGDCCVFRSHGEGPCPHPIRS